MDHQTILRPNDVDLKRLPIGAREAFVLSQIDGRLTLEEIAEVAGLEVNEATKLAQVLIDLGAASKVRVDPRAEGRSSTPRADKPIAREDPRVDRKSVRTEARKSIRSDPRADPRAEQVSMRPPPKASIRPSATREPSATRPPSATRQPTTPRPMRKPSRKSIRIPAASDVCELDEATLTVLEEIDARLNGAKNYYAVLEIERDADKKTVKRAYFGFASKFHPDRFFGKKLGKAGPQIDRIFKRLTEAHDILTSATDRATYDKSLPPAPAPRKTIAPAPRKTMAPGAQRKTMAPARPSRKMSNATMARANTRQLSAANKATMKLTAMTAEPMPPPSQEPRIDIEAKRRNFRDAAMEIKTQERVDLFLEAAEEALEKNDVVTAANNYRLALEHREDRRIRMIFEDVDARAKKVRFDRQMGPAKAAERDHRWNDAAILLTKAHGIVPGADVAIRAAHALRMCGSDIDQAIKLAEQAVSLEPRVVTHHVTFIEILIAAKKFDRAEEELETAKDLAPKNDAVKDLASLLSKRKKS